MPVYEFEVPAKITIRMEGETPEKAEANLEGLLEDFYMEIPCGGHEIKFGLYPATVWAQDMKATLKRELPKGIDPTKSTRMSVSDYMKMCRGEMDEDEEELDPNKIMNNDPRTSGVDYITEKEYNQLQEIINNPKPLPHYTPAKTMTAEEWAKLQKEKEK